MAVSYVARKCTQCAGKLEYVKEKKIWQCLYCGAEIERETQYDGLYTIKNVVRQALLDLSYRKLDSAAKHLVECEKIDSRYVGTLIARLTLQMVKQNTPRACAEQERKNLISQIKRDYDALCALGTTVTEEEEVLYTFFEASDIYATLLLVFDSLNDTPRKNYLFKLLNPKEVYSKDASINLLNYSLKNGKTELVDAVIRQNNLDPGFALYQLLEWYPDGEKKVQHVKALFQGEGLKDEGKPIVEAYLNTSTDGVATKGAVAALAYGAKVSVPLETVIKRVLAFGDGNTVRRVLDQFCSTDLNDQEINRIVEFAFTSPGMETAMAALSSLKESNQYVMISQKLLIEMLNRKDLQRGDKTDLIRKALSFKVDTKTKEGVLTSYLCFNQDAVEDREKIIALLLEATATIPTTTFENYILKCSTDGANKPNIVAQILTLDLNLGFFPDLMSRYLIESLDQPEVKEAIINFLGAKGLRISFPALIAYLCTPAKDQQAKLRLSKRLLAEGSPVRGTAANAYLEQIKMDEFDPELFALLLSTATTISIKALFHYLLYCRDREASKVANFQALLAKCGESLKLNASRCKVNHLENRVECNLLQGYLLLTPDSLSVAQLIVQILLSHKIKISADLTVEGQGKMKFKKYVLANRGKLREVTNQICEAYKVDSLFFNS